jgi:lipid II:glycine glycyltransferase (peptidoglycan interpeptide bridge formation enzyme)
LINSPDFTDIRPFTWNGWQSKVFYAYYLDTRTDMQTNMDLSTRRTIAKAIRQGIEIKPSHDISEFYELFSMTFRKQGLRPPVSESFLTRIFDLVTSTASGEMWIAQTPSAETITAHIILWDNRRAYAWSAGSQPRFGNTGAPSLLIQEEFNVLKKRGVNEYNLMSGNFPQFAYFTSGFNPRLVPYYGVSKSRFAFAIASGVRGLAKELLHYILPPKRTFKSSHDPVLETDAQELS